MLHSEHITTMDSLLVQAYYTLSDIECKWPDRHTEKGQRLLCALRDSIAEELYMNVEDVQNRKAK